MGYYVVVFSHIAAGIVLLAVSIVGEPIVRAAVRRAQTQQELRAFLEIGRSMALLSPASAFVLLASGLYLTSVGTWWEAGWLQVSIVFWVVNATVAVRVVRPAVDRLAAEAGRAAEAGISDTLHGLRWSAAWTWGCDVMAANDVAILFLMSAKPGLAASVAVVVVTNATVAIGRLAFSFRRTAVPGVARP